MTLRVNHNGASSPPSSTDADQHTGHGTPSTNLTMMSPDNGYQSFVGLSNNQNGLVRHPQGAGRPGRPALPAAMHYADPLRLATGTHLSHVMSPTANAFEPPPVAGPQANGNFPAHLANRVPRLRVRPGLMAHPGVPSTVNPELVPTIQTMVPLRHCGNVQYGTFSIADRSYRAMEISKLYNANAYHRIQDLFAIHRFPSLREIDSRDSHNGTYRVSFYDSRDARQAFALARGQLPHNVNISWLGPHEHAISTGRQNTDLISDHEGELIVSLIPYNNAHLATFGHFFQALETCGDVKAVHSYAHDDRRVVAFRVEFYHVASAAAFRSEYDEETIMDTLVDVINYEPDIRAAVVPAAAQGASITGRTAMRQADMAEIAHRMPGLMAPRHRIGNNQVSVDRIQNGQDVRTTIMLRNIPNRITQSDLKQYLDQTSRGLYDFMYLRIDFMNECNVGYAFINFIDPLAIMDFANVRAGQSWNMHGSYKRAEISYATIQGRENLVQKFRNSSVMLENPAFRPKLYLAYPHPYAGNEEDFPKPDNLSKMRRSIENAEHIGLYTRNLSYHQPARLGYFIRPAHNGHHLLQHRRGNPARLAAPVAQPPRLLLAANGDARRTNARFVDVNAAGDPFAGRASGPAQPRRFH